MVDKKRLIEEILVYAKANLELDELDIDFYRNFLMHEFNEKEVGEPLDKETILDISKQETPIKLVNKLTELYQELGYSHDEISKKITYIFGELTPLNSQIQKEYDNYVKANKQKEGMDKFSKICVANNYVAADDLKRNYNINTGDKHFNLIAEVNMAKPEKSNADIAKELKKVKQDSNYPECCICKSNVGCYGSCRTVPRNNLRTLRFNLNNEEWFMQYSPYQYVLNHCIVFTSKHEKMTVCRKNIAALFDFVDLVPNYYIGSNSDLPIVGGSILTHQHFQGGLYIKNLPMFEAKDKKQIIIKGFDDLSSYILDYPGTIFRFSSSNKETLINLGDKIITLWRNYDDENLKIIADGHNTMTTVVLGKQCSKDHNYNMYISLRNNYTNESCPTGLFHTRPELHHIKAEGIGLVELMGTFVLPARLDRQLRLARTIINNPSEKETILNDYPDIKPFDDLILGINNHTFKDVSDYLGYACETMLKDIDVFKFDNINQDGLNKFIKTLNNK